MALSSFFGRRNNIWDMPDPMEMMVTMFDNPRAGSFARDVQAVASTSVDWKETPAEHIFKVDMPGLRKEDVQVHLEDGRTLSISGKREKEEVQKTDTWHRVERSSGHFMRKFRLPENTNLDQISAKVENGVLTVNVPKTEKKAEKRSIDIGGHNEDKQPAAITAEHQQQAGEAAPEQQATHGSTPAHNGQQ